MSRRADWAYLSRVVEGPSAHLQALLDAGFDVERVVWGIKHREEWIGAPLLKQTKARWDWDQAQQDLATITDIGGRLITPDDSEWPHVELDHAFGFAKSGLSEHSQPFTRFIT